jgi:hypothetical protein
MRHATLSHFITNNFYNLIFGASSTGTIPIVIIKAGLNRNLLLRMN